MEGTISIMRSQNILTSKGSTDHVSQLVKESGDITEVGRKQPCDSLAEKYHDNSWVWMFAWSDAVGIESKLRKFTISYQALLNIFMINIFILSHTSMAYILMGNSCWQDYREWVLKLGTSGWLWKSITVELCGEIHSEPANNPDDSNAITIADWLKVNATMSTDLAV